MMFMDGAIKVNGPLTVYGKFRPIDRPLRAFKTTTMTISWIYLLIASLSEAIWLYAVKFMDVKAVKAMGWGGLFSDPLHAKALLPFLGYAVFGAGNVIFLSMSMRTIPASTAYAVWMAVALVSSKLIDTFWFKQPMNGMQMLWFAFIIVGVVGLKRAA
jgi:quaternary ammonium compound-resistance protein SugE